MSKSAESPVKYYPVKYYDVIDGYFTAIHVDGTHRVIGPLKHKQNELFIEGLKKARQCLNPQK